MFLFHYSATGECTTLKFRRALTFLPLISEYKKVVHYGTLHTVDIAVLIDSLNLKHSKCETPWFEMEKVKLPTTTVNRNQGRRLSIKALTYFVFLKYKSYSLFEYRQTFWKCTPRSSKYHFDHFNSVAMSRIKRNWDEHANSLNLLMTFRINTATTHSIPLWWELLLERSWERCTTVVTFWCPCSKT